MAVSAPALNVASIQEGHSTLYVLRWPIDAQGEEDGLLGLCMVLMKREGGFLLGLPSGLIPFSDLQVASAANLYQLHPAPHLLPDLASVKESEVF